MQVINKKYEKPLNDKNRKKRPTKMEKYIKRLDLEKEEAQKNQTNKEITQ